jgi:hypothetical protein
MRYFGEQHTSLDALAMSLKAAGADIVNRGVESGSWARKKKMREGIEKGWDVRVRERERVKSEDVS